LPYNSGYRVIWHGSLTNPSLGEPGVRWCLRALKYPVTARVVPFWFVGAKTIASGSVNPELVGAMTGRPSRAPMPARSLVTSAHTPSRSEWSTLAGAVTHCKQLAVRS
jgi:hypothetical protein